jgi:alpha-amylase
MGFTAIWITPVTEQLPQSTSDGEAYHGYWQQDMYVLHFMFVELRLTLENSYSINSNYGTAEDLQALATALHDRGMYLMVDVVANHMVGLLHSCW